MSTGIYSIGVSGLAAAQLALLVTEHNIVNANTDGYNRQRTIQATSPAIMSGAGSIGQGVRVTTVQRMYSSFLSSQVNSAQTSLSETDVYLETIGQIDNMLADVNAGLSPALQGFFSGVQQVAANPSQLPNRQSMVSSGLTLADRFHALETRLDQLNDQVNGRIQDGIGQINSFAAQIADLNQRIIIAEGSYGQPANDLLDQRDHLVSELNKVVRVSTTTKSDGSFNVFVGTGQQLVVGTQAMTLTALASSGDPSKIAVGLQTAGGVQELAEFLVNGGELGGLLNFRNQALDPAYNQLGRVAASLALTFNAQHALGQDLLGQVSGAGLVDDFFTIRSPDVISNARNLGAGSVTASFIDPAADSRFTLAFAAGTYTITRASDGQAWTDTSLASLQTTVNAATGNSLILPNLTAGSISVTDGRFFTRLTGSDYKVAFGAGGAYTVTRLSDNTAVAAGVGVGSVVVDGLSIAIGAVGASGDSFIVQPTRSIARDIDVDSRFTTDPRLVAAAAPVRTQATLTNTGNMVLAQGSVNTGYSLAGLPLTLTANTGAGTLTGFPAAANVVAFYADGSSTVTSGGSVALSNGGSTLAKVSFNGMTFTMSGAPANGDSFTLATNGGGVDDSRNGLLLAQLQISNTIAGGTATYQSSYAQLVADNGIRTREAQVRSDAQTALLQQSQASREALSGVNLDEEAANLIKFQQAYQASAKMLEVGSRLFETILDLG